MNTVQTTVRNELRHRQVAVLHQTSTIQSTLLERNVTLECFLPVGIPGNTVPLLLINDGQLMKELGLQDMLQTLLESSAITPTLCVAIHAGANRMMEYGVARSADYLGRGARAGLYTRFIFEELLPYLQSVFQVRSFTAKSFAGFSLGGLSALDIVWNHPHEFNTAGVFSGSLWWRSKDYKDGYNEDTDRIMHAQVRAGAYKPGLRFFFETGTLDETDDRNNNGIIDSIDDTMGLINELLNKGYHPDDIAYLELHDGRHDTATWALAMPAFLKWRE